MKYFRSLFLFGLFLFGLFLFGCESDSHRIRGKLPDIALRHLDQSEVTFSQISADLNLLVIWATWCQPCIYEIPSLNSLAAKYKDKGFKVVAVNIDDPSGKKVAKIMETFNVKYQVVLGEEKIMAQLGNLEAIPTSFLITKDGRILEKFEGLVPEHRMELKILEALEKKEARTASTP